MPKQQNVIEKIKPARRTQAERLAETREKIIAATVAYIDEKGFHQATMQRVAKKAQVTVGAVQHHFASKTELLAAVVEDNFKQLARNVQHLDLEGSSLESQISQFVDASWEFCNSSRYQSGLQILLGMREEMWSNYDSWVSSALGKVISGSFAMWHRLYSDFELTDDERTDILLYIFSSLSGTALLYRISQDTHRVDRDLHELKLLLGLRFKSCKKKPKRPQKT
jgi:AcrR family transcriptional regulator